VQYIFAKAHRYFKKSGNLSRNLDDKHSKEIRELTRRRKPEIRRAYIQGYRRGSRKVVVSK
jgi:hypothetical protein